jgi:hypothetical protein
MSDLAKSLEPPVAEAEVAAADEQPTQNTETKEEAVVEVQKDEGERQKTVPHQALHEERKRRQEAEASLRQVRESQQVMEQRFQALWQQVQPKEVVPDKEQQPLEYIDHELAQTKQKIAQWENWQAQQQQMQQRQQQAAQLAHWAKNEASSFAAEKSDFKPAYEHLMQLKAREFHARGVPNESIPHAIAEFELGVFWEAHQQGKNPGELMYRMAQSTGYANKPNAEAKVQTLNKGMEAAKTLGNSGVQGGMPTPEQIAEMSEEQFEVFKAELSKKGKRLSDVM